MGMNAFFSSFAVCYNPLMDGEKEDSTLSRRERKKKQTREALEAAALRLFRSKGYDRTTIKDITEAVDISPRTFFRYFDSKEAVLFGDWRKNLDLLRELILARPREEPVFIAMYQAALELAEADKENESRLMLVKKLAEKSRRIGDYERNIIYPGFERVVTEALALRMGVDPASDPRPRVIAAVSVAAWTTARRIWMESGGKRSISEILSQTFGFLMEPLQESEKTKTKSEPKPASARKGPRRRAGSSRGGVS